MTVKCTVRKSLIQEDSEEKAKTKVHRECFEDFAQNSFRVTIGRVQQLALKQAGGRLPTPKEQLALVNKRREAKRGRASSVNLGKFHITFALSKANHGQLWIVNSHSHQHQSP